MSSVIYIEYERAFFWRSDGSNDWNPMPVEVHDTTAFRKDPSCATAIDYTHITRKAMSLDGGMRGKAKATAKTK